MPIKQRPRMGAVEFKSCTKVLPSVAVPTQAAQRVRRSAVPPGATSPIVAPIVSSRIPPGKEKSVKEAFLYLHVMEPSPHPTGLVELWRDRADQLDKFGDPNSARLPRHGFDGEAPQLGHVHRILRLPSVASRPTAAAGMPHRAARW